MNLQELHPLNSLSTVEYKSINQLVYRSFIDIPSLRSLAGTNIHIFLCILEIQEKPPSFIELLFSRKTVVFNQSINQSTKIRQPEPLEHELTNHSIVHLTDEVWSWEFVLQRLICWTNEEQRYVKVVAELGVKLVLVRIINLILLQSNLNKLNCKIFFNGANF